MTQPIVVQMGISLNELALTILRMNYLQSNGLFVGREVSHLTDGKTISETRIFVSVWSSHSPPPLLSTPLPYSPQHSSRNC